MPVPAAPTEVEPAARRHHALARRIGMTPEQFVIAVGIVAALAVAALDTATSTAQKRSAPAVGG